MPRIYLLVFLLFCFCRGSAQINLKNIIKSKTNVLKEKAIEKTAAGAEKKSREFDESNFNYAISFLDNSALFEADEKGSALTSDLLLGTKMASKEVRTTEDVAYTNLKNGEMLMAGNKPFLAEKSLRVAKLLYEGNGQTGTTNYIQSVSDLGLLFQSTGRYVQAKKFDEQALQLRRSGSNKGMLIVSINNNAVLKKETGEYVEAESDFKEALGMANDPVDPLAQSLIYNNLAMTYLDMNKLTDAESFMNKSLAAAKSAMDSSSANFIKLQINLANVYRFEKKYAEAEALYLRAIDEKEKKMGAHPDLAHLEKGLAQLYLEMGRTGKVEKLLQKAYDIDKRKLGESNPATLAVQEELANYYRFANQGDRAMGLIKTVVEKKKTIYGENHPSYLQALEDLALSQWQTNDIAGAKANYKVVITNTLNYIHTFFNSLNENEKTLYWEKTNARLQRFYSFASEHGADDPDLVNEFYNVVLNTKGFLLNNSSKIRSIISASSDEALRTAFQQWLETKEYLNQAYQLSREELVKERVNVDSLRSRTDELERELSQRSALFKESNGQETVSYDAVQRWLGPGDAAVEIVELNEYKNGFTDKGSFVALLMTANGIKLIQLGDSKQIQDAIGNFRKNVMRQAPDNDGFNVTWKALDDQLKGISQLYLSLDGDYYQLSIISLKDPSGKYVLDKYALRFVGNTKEIGRILESDKSAVKPESAFLVGNPLFGKNAGVPPLPGTEEEVKSIGKILNADHIKTTSLLGKEATEVKLKSVSSPGILHIATHGYFFADLDKVRSKKVLGEDIMAARENPLLRSGILLANCENVFEKNYEPFGKGENGVLTAYEAMSLNLDKTDLVILSACETGLGTIRQGEGVYGLQRAFLISGAQSIIMSLWKVSDVATRELMTAFYSDYTRSGNKSKAFIEAVKQLKVKYKDPYFWGAFVLLNK